MAITFRLFRDRGVGFIEWLDLLPVVGTPLQKTMGTSDGHNDWEYESANERQLSIKLSNVRYAGAPPSAPGSGGATSGATTCFGGLSGAGFAAGDPPTGGGGLIRRPWSMISFICEPSRVSYSSNALAIVSSLSRFTVSVCLAS